MEAIKREIMGWMKKFKPNDLIVSDIVEI